MMMTALVLHLPHMVAVGGKLVPSPVTAMSPPIAAAPGPFALTSAFFFRLYS